MQILSAQQTKSLLGYSAIADAIAELLEQVTHGLVHAPERIHLPLTDGVLLAMPASDSRLAITKLVTVHQSNAQRGFPSVQGEVLVMDAQTGQRLVMLEGATVTAQRTAALSLLAARWLAPDPNAPLLIVGAGVQAKAHLEAFAQGLGTRTIFVHSRSMQKARALVEHAWELGLKAQTVSDPHDAKQARLIVTATTSQKALFQHLPNPGTFVAAVGAYRPSMAELAPTLVQRALEQNALWVDTLAGTRAEAGDLLQAEISWDGVQALEAAVKRPELREHTKRQALVVFKSVGHALWDLAAAHVAVRGLERGQA